MATRADQTGGSSDIAPVYVVFGNEAFLRTQAVHRLLDRLLKPEERGLCCAEYDGTAEPAAVLDDVRTLPFLGPRRVVLVRDADRLIGVKRGSGSETNEDAADAKDAQRAKGAREALEKYAESPCRTGVLILECGSFPSNLRLYKRVAALGGCIPCEAPKPWKLPEWLQERCRNEYGKQLALDAARSILDHVGESLGVLDGELAKLAVYVGSRATITTADVERLVGHDREQKVFGVLNAMADGDRKAALHLWEDVWETDRAAEGRAVGGIAWGVRQYLEAHRRQQTGATAHELARHLRTDERRVEQRLQAFPPDRLLQQLAQLADADVAAKTGARSVRTSIERFIMEHTAARTR